jgi:hypothetical protein
MAFVGILFVHAFYVGVSAASPASGWTDLGFGNQAPTLNLGAYWQGQYSFIGFSYALTAAFTMWALSRSSCAPEQGSSQRVPLPQE